MSLPTSPQILIVGRDPLVCSLLQRVVNQLGQTVIATTMSGSTVLALVAALHPDVILLDTYLPDLDGFEVANHIQKFCPAPVILISDEPESLELAARVAQAGARAYLVQPFSGDDLAQAVKQALNHANDAPPQAKHLP